MPFLTALGIDLMLRIWKNQGINAILDSEKKRLEHNEIHTVQLQDLHGRQ